MTFFKEGLTHRFKNEILRTKGIGLIEVVVSIAIIATILVGLLSAFNVYIKAALSNTEKIQSAFLLEEGLEVVRFIRNEDWNNISALATSTDYYIVFNVDTWEIVTTASSTSSFTRIMNVADVFRRDIDDDIIASTSVDAKTFDVKTKFITIKV